MNINTNNKNSVFRLFTVSWISALTIAVASLVIVFGAVFSAHYKGSYFHSYIYNRQHPAQSATASYTEVSTKLSASTLVDNIPLMIFWAGVGYIAFTFTMAVWRAFSSVNEIKEELDYVNIDRHELLVVSFQHLATRIAALIGWIVYAVLSLRVVLSYIISVSYAGTAAENLFFDAGYVLLAFVICAIALHVHVIFLRLICLRARIFGD